MGLMGWDKEEAVAGILQTHSLGLEQKGVFFFVRNGSKHNWKAAFLLSQLINIITKHGAPGLVNNIQTN